MIISLLSLLMKFLLSLLLASAVAVRPASEPIPDCYNVKFKSDTSDVKARAHKANIHASFKREWNTAIKGYSICTKDKNTIAKIERDPEVDFVEEDGVVKKNCIIQPAATWGIRRTVKRTLPLPASYSYREDGTGVTVYVLDTGIYLEHEEFEGRATWGANFADSSLAQTDVDGHGTHCAGTIGGKLYGMAKKVNLVAVKILDDQGSGSMSGIISGIDWILANKPLRSSVASMSVGGGFSAALNSAITNSMRFNLTFVVAAGNDNANSCSSSPASAAAAITVAASDIYDRKASFSNWGTCVDVFAPGVSITSAGIAGPASTATYSGTSMACPHVAGQVAKYIQNRPAITGTAVHAFIVSSAVTGLITGIAKQTKTTNALLQGICV